MSDEIDFRFTGKLADENRMDFYESARFQYAAARLSVKLDRFRRYGKFPDKVTRKGNTGIDLKTFKDGSFIIQLSSASLQTSIDRPFLDLSLPALWTYVVERIFKPAQTEDIRRLLTAEPHLLAEYDSAIANNDDPSRLTLELLENQLFLSDLAPSTAELLQRLKAESQRRQYLARTSDQFSRISKEQDAFLVTMAAPLLRELSVPLRRSASHAIVSIRERDASQPILAVDAISASEVELVRVDPEIQTVRINIVQYDKETGWGKFRNAEFDGRAPFSISADKKDSLQSAVLQNMNKPEVLVQAHYVRSIAGINKRLIILDFPYDRHRDD